jgi:ParB family transcriptional regulator, chromosome partitioning protein
MNKRGLGRGLGALLSSTPTEGEHLLDIAVDEVEPNPNQPRKSFDPVGITELATSLKNSGMIQPVVVRRTGTGYQLIAGERRWRAAREAGLERIPAMVREVTDAESLELALVENLLREDLNPIEEAEAYQRLLADFSWTQEQLAGRVGKDRSTVANALRILRLPEVVQQDLRDGRLTMGHARALLSLTTEPEQLKLREEILAHSWSVRATEKTVEQRRTAPPPAPHRSAEIRALEDSIQRALMTRVRIVGTARSGRIEVTYATPDELERISDALGVRRE